MKRLSHNQDLVLKWSTQSHVENQEGGYPQLLLAGAATNLHLPPGFEHVAHLKFRSAPASAMAPWRTGSQIIRRKRGILGESLGAVSHIKLRQGAFGGNPPNPPVSLVPPVSLLVGFPQPTFRWSGFGKIAPYWLVAAKVCNNRPDPRVSSPRRKRERTPLGKRHTTLCRSLRI